MTDEELIKTLDMIHEEQGLRKKDKEADVKKRLDNMSESDFIRGRVFGIKGNIRKGIVVKKEARYVTWRWVSSELGEGTIDSISDLMYWITWLGGIELEHLTERRVSSLCTHEFEYRPKPVTIPALRCG